MEHQGIEWTVKTPEGQVLTWDTCSLSFPVSDLIRWPWRPVSTQTWDYAPRGWGDITGPESKQWGEWWWWQGEGIPLQAVKARRCDDGDFLLVVNGIDMYLSELGGRFIAPIPVPEVNNVG